MRLFKPTYKGKNGKTKRVKKWWIETRDHLEIVRRFAAYSDKRVSESFGRNVQRLIDYKRNGDPPDTTLSLWLEQLSPKLQNRFVGIGLLEAKKIEAGKPLIEYLPEFEKTIISRAVKTDEQEVTQVRIKRDVSHSQIIIPRVTRVIKACGFVAWRDVTGAEIDKFISQLQKEGMSPQTAHHYVQTFRRFAHWMVKQGYADQAPEIKNISVPTKFQRAFEIDEFERLLKVTRPGPMRKGMTGDQRYMLYLLAVETGLRRGELRSLTPASFDLKNNCVFVKGQHTKNGDDAIQQFTPQTGILLKDYIKGKMPNVQLFPVPDVSSIMIQQDCTAADIEFDNHKGKIKFHSLRHTCGTFLADKGVHPKVIQEIMRHKDINLTMSRYTHTLKGQVVAAIARISNFALQHIKVNTGTD